MELIKISKCFIVHAITNPNIMSTSVYLVFLNSTIENILPTT